MTICSHCGANNRDGAAFCRNCGRLLLAACPRCHAAAAPDANFCDACGGPLGPRAWTGTAGITNYELRITNEDSPATAARPLSPAPQLPLSPAPTAPEPTLALDRFIPRELLAKLSAARGSVGERRVVTLLFCDLKGSTAFAEQLDPEEWTEIVNGAFEVMVRPIYKYEGTVARLMGDGLLAFFGAPIAHEDDPRRAVLAGLAIVDGIRAWRAGLPPAAADLDVRVGINTGLVVVGAVGSDLRLEYSAIGDAINLAARMEQTAVPGTVQIAEETYRLVADEFEVESLGSIAVKGKTRPVNAYRVLRRAVKSRRAANGLRAPLVDRRMAWEALQAAFADLGNGRGSVVFLTGDAGLGKTRLFDEAAERLLPELNPPGRIYDASAVSYETNQPYGLLVRLLRRPLGLMSGDSPDRIRQAIAAAAPADEDRLLMETLFGVAVSDNGQETGGEAFAAQLDACMERSWRAQAAAGPLVLALDDLQWLDASSADRLTRLIRLTEDTPILFIGAMRRDRRSPAWALKETVARELPHRQTEVNLNPLNDGESRAMLAGLLEVAEPPAALSSLILDKAEGNPLFLEEVVRHLVERGDLRRPSEASGEWEVTPTTITLPDSLQSLLTARIDRLDENARRVLQVAAVIGRHFYRSPLAALVDDPARLDTCLLELQRLELIREIGRVPEPSYLFNHSLAQEAVYNTILLKQRRALHLRVAEVIETLRAANLTAAAATLAHHFIEGESPRRALPYLLMAGGAALRLHAVGEAITAYDRALPIARALPDVSADLITIYTNRGRALELLSQFAEAKATYEEMEVLAIERADPALELEALIAQGKLHANVTPFYDPVRGRALMERARDLAEATGNRPAEVRILWNLVNIDRFDLNTLTNALVNGDRGIALARELGLKEELAYLLNDMGDIYGTAGQVELARAILVEARELWRTLGNEGMLADSLSNSAIWESLHGDLGASLAFSEEANAIATRLGNPWGEAYSTGVRGLTLGLMGLFGRAVTDLRTGVEKAKTANFVGGQVIIGAFLSRILLEIGDIAGAVTVAQPAVVIGEERLPQFAGIALGRLAAAQIAQGDLDAAAETLANPLALVENQQYFVIYDICAAHINLALARRQFDNAMTLADEAIGRLSLIGADVWLPDLRHLRAGALMGLGRFDEAAVDLDMAIDETRRMGIRGGLWQVLVTRIELAQVRGEPDDEWRAAAVAEIDFLAANTWPDELRAVFLARPDVGRILQGADVEH